MSSIKNIGIINFQILIHNLYISQSLQFQLYSMIVALQLVFHSNILSFPLQFVSLIDRGDYYFSYSY